MALYLELPEELILGYVLMYIGDVREMLVLRLVSKAFNEKTELLLPAIVELDLTKLQEINNDPIYSIHKKTLESFADLIKMQEFRIPRLNFSKELDFFDVCIGRGLIFLAENIISEPTIEEIEEFFLVRLTADLPKILKFGNDSNIVQKAEEECIRALSISIQIDEQQRKILNWLTGALKLNQMLKAFGADFNYISIRKVQQDFFQTRVKKISKFFGFVL